MVDKELYYKTYQNIWNSFEQLIQSKLLSEEHTSPFWKKILDERKNFPTFSEIFNFRRGMATGLGYAKDLKKKSEKIDFQLNYHRAISCVPIEFIKKNLESNIGNPYQFSKNDIISSGTGLHNCTVAYWILNVIKNHFLDTKIILEIGAGYGGVADIILKNVNPDILIICDLPHNLFLSSYYLAVNHPEYKYYLIRDKVPEEIRTKSLIFCTPENIEYLRFKIDLVINTYSFQEMTMQEINRYFKYISNNLSEEGIFYFFNTFGAEGVKKPSDYPFNDFYIESWLPPAVPQPNFFHRKQHMEVILRKKNKNQWPIYFESISYPLSLLMFMGLNKNIVELCNNLVKNMLNNSDIEYFHNLQNILLCKTPQEGITLINKIKNSNIKWKCISYYISGLLYVFAGDLKNALCDLKESINSNLQDFAKSKACIGLCLLLLRERNKSEVKIYFKLAIDTMPQFAFQLKKWKNPSIGNVFFKTYHFSFPNLDLDSNFRFK